jgi:hypothetical protein
MSKRGNWRNEVNRSESKAGMSDGVAHRTVHSDGGDGSKAIIQIDGTLQFCSSSERLTTAGSRGMVREAAKSIKHIAAMLIVYGRTIKHPHSDVHAICKHGGSRKAFHMPSKRRNRMVRPMHGLNRLNRGVSAIVLTQFCSLNDDVGSCFL